MGTASPAAGTERQEVLLARVQELQEALEAAGNPPPPELLEELLGSVVQMYGAGLERILQALHEAGEEGQRIAAGLAEDPLLATLLLIHDLHPVPLVDRVQAALESVRPYMESHGGNVELLSLEDGVARIHLRGSCSDCAASSVTLELAIKQALEDAAPDLVGLQVEGVAAQTMNGQGLPMATGTPAPAAVTGTSAPAGLELPVIMSPPPAPPAWFEVAADVDDGAVVAVSVAGRDLVVANVDGTLLAYGNSCAGCGGRLHRGSLRAGALSCPGCGRSFFLPRAGRSMDDDQLQLEPVPLLREQDRVKVALVQ
jgi:Fe-S cluster biogenesis protein NfuA/nitrite reductase/ring-hydroxylating ferredoxin subunit